MAIRAASRLTLCVLALLCITLNEASAADLRLTLRAIDEWNRPLTDVNVGDMFRLQVLVEDIRPDATGVGFAYTDIIFDPTLAEGVGPIQYGSSFPFLHRGNVRSGLIDEAGALRKIFGDTLGSLTLFEIPFVAIGSGQLHFSFDPTDAFVHDFAILGDVPKELAWDEIEFVETTLNIRGGVVAVPEPSTIMFAFGIALPISLVAWARRRRAAA